MMRPKDIEKIANSVVGSFSQPTRASAGCGDISITQEFTCSAGYYCQDAAGYECGGQGLFLCTSENFDCISAFDCPGSFDCGALFNCVATYSFG